MPGSGGAELKNLPAELIIKFNPENSVPVKKFVLPNKDSNVNEYKVEFIGSNGKSVEERTSKNPTEPILVNSPENVVSIVLTIISTNDGKNPRNVEISVQSCLPKTTEPQVSAGTTSKPTTVGQEFTPSPSVTTVQPAVTSQEVKTSTPYGLDKIFCLLNHKQNILQ